MKRFLFLFLFIILNSNSLIANNDTNAILHDESKKYTLNFKTQPISEVIRALARQASLNVILPENMPENISISLNNVTLKSAIESILLSRGYNYII